VQIIVERSSTHPVEYAIVLLVERDGVWHTVRTFDNAHAPDELLPALIPTSVPHACGLRAARWIAGFQPSASTARRFAAAFAPFGLRCFAFGFAAPGAQHQARCSYVKRVPHFANFLRSTSERP
jgi:hypothetical protein